MIQTHENRNILMVTNQGWSVTYVVLKPSSNMCTLIQSLYRINAHQLNVALHNYELCVTVAEQTKSKVLIMKRNLYGHPLQSSSGNITVIYGTISVWNMQTFWMQTNIEMDGNCCCIWSYFTVCVVTLCVRWINLWLIQRGV